ncbi:MAG: M20/M25/M40 family metallo-hydrolase [Candidatus Brockarchaeota archaeon]|nr:M20/M25/M40 family metallo-hydrolase [Candidatus Brockarchaeota archaeon]
MSVGEVCKEIESRSPRFVESLRKLVKQPSVSAKGTGLAECADLVKEMMAEAGIEAELIGVEGAPPFVYGEALAGKPGARTIIFYNHYDVQPPEPLELWSSDPFAAEVRGGKMFGRGVSDNKADIVSRINLVKVFLDSGGLPCNVKFVIEGEEEIGSPHMPALVERHAERLKADACIWESGGLDEKDRPEITLGMKGILYVELLSRVANRDAHSSLGAAVANPAWRLVWALSKIKGEDERILVPGWYEDVRPFTEKELEALEKMPMEEELIKADLGVEEFLLGASGMELKRALVGGPTATICGFQSGYAGPGSKTVLPSTASAKLDFRLVPDQKPGKLLKALESHLAHQGFGDIKIVPLSQEEASRTSLDEEIVHCASEAASRTYGRDAVIKVSSAGSGPMYLFTNRLKIPSVCVGCTHAFENAHAPDENLRLDVFIKGTEWVARTLDLFGKRDP